jgi:hypothetical protein
MELLETLSGPTPLEDPVVLLGVDVQGLGVVQGWSVPRVPISAYAQIECPATICVRIRLTVLMTVVEVPERMVRRRGWVR